MNTQGGQSVTSSPPFFQQGGAAVLTGFCQTVVFPCRTARGLPLIPFRKPFPAQAPENGVNRALLHIREHGMETAEQLIRAGAVLGLPPFPPDPGPLLKCSG